QHIYPNFFADVVVTGDIDTQRSTSCYYSVIRVPNSSCSISAGSKRQSCVSHSTLKAELVAAHFGVCVPMVCLRFAYGAYYFLISHRCCFTRTTRP
ncbi:MAG: hypothetical protein ACKPKO_63295, partial [Candidatus Fonsibacter sp.]